MEDTNMQHDPMLLKIHQLWNELLKVMYVFDIAVQLSYCQVFC